MRVLVLKPFLYAADHIRSVMLEEGTEHDVADDCAPGLIAEGFVELAAAADAEAAPDEDAAEPKRKRRAAPAADA